MKINQSDRGFRRLEHPVYLPPHEEKPIIIESSAIGNYEDSFDIPGGSFLWFGDHHLNREEVRQLIQYLQHWLDQKCLPEKTI